MNFFYQTKRYQILLSATIVAIFSLANRPAFTETINIPTYGQEVGCLAMNIYHEARGESKKGQLAVAAVTMNRVASKHYPNTVCKVVWQRKQFSWTTLRAKYHLIKNSKAWDNALHIAFQFVEGTDWNGVGKATHYHVSSISPSWKDDDRLIAEVGNHLFYAL